MNEFAPVSQNSVHDAARSLIEQRTTLVKWLDELSGYAAEVPPHVLGRVRDDYNARLTQVNQDLSGHVEALQQRLSDRAAALAAAEERHAAALDALAEVRLRHLIGEIDGAEWDARRPELEEKTEAAERNRVQVADEVSRLRSLVSEVSAAPPREEQPTAVRSAEESDPDVDALFDAWSSADGESEDQGTGEPLAWLDGLSEETTKPVGSGAEFDELEFLKELGSTGPAEVESQESGISDDLAFLEELDRAIAGSTPARNTGPADLPLSSAPGAKEGLVCKECGATNDPNAWYCEICGMELT